MLSWGGQGLLKGGSHLRGGYRLGCEQTWIRRAEVEPRSPGTLPTTRSSKSRQVPGPWELDTARGEGGEGKKREWASGAPEVWNPLEVIKPQGQRKRRTGRRAARRSNRPPASLPLGPHQGQFGPHVGPLSPVTAPPPTPSPPAPLPLTRALLVSNLVSILQARSSQVLLPARPATPRRPAAASTSAARSRGSRKLPRTRTSGPCRSWPPRRCPGGLERPRPDGREPRLPLRRGARWPRPGAAPRLTWEVGVFFACCLPASSWQVRPPRPVSSALRGEPSGRPSRDRRRLPPGSRRPSVLPPCKSSFSSVPATEVPPSRDLKVSSPPCLVGSPHYLLQATAWTLPLSGGLLFPRSPATPPTIKKDRCPFSFLPNAFRHFKVKAAVFCGDRAAPGGK